MDNENKTLPEIAQQMIESLGNVLTDEHASEADCKYAKLMGESCFRYLFEVSAENRAETANQKSN